jgi:structural maintenance of chromosome 2
VKFSDKKDAAKERLEHLSKIKKMIEQELVDLDERVEQVTRDRCENGGAFYELEEHGKELAKEIAKFKTLLGLKTSSISEERAALKGIESNLMEAQTSKEEAVARYEVFVYLNLKSLQAECEVRVQDYERKKSKLKDTENLVQTLTTGLGQGQENGYGEQLSAAKQEASVASSTIQQLSFKASHLMKELKVEEPKAKQAKKDNATLVTELESKKNVLAMITEEIEGMSFDSSLEGPLQERKTILEKQMTALDQEISHSQRSVHMDFDYSDPTPNFDRSKVKGLVATLISIPKEHHDKANALEVFSTYIHL